MFKVCATIDFEEEFEDINLKINSKAENAIYELCALVLNVINQMGDDAKPPKGVKVNRHMMKKEMLDMMYNLASEFLEQEKEEQNNE